MVADIEVVVISLPTALARRERISEDFAGCPYRWSFFDASDGTDDTAIPYRPDRALAQMGRGLKQSEIGCFDSHYRVLRDFSAKVGKGWLLVCEDDLLVDFSFDFDALVGAMQLSGVDYVRLYSRRVPAAKQIKFWRNRWLVRYRWEPFGMQCYLVNVRGAQRLIANLRDIGRPIDDEVDRFWENGVPPYSLFPHPALELDSPSSIIRDSDASATRARWLRYRARRVADRVAAVLASTRNAALDRRFADALASQDRQD